MYCTLDARVSGERVWLEWRKILVGNHAGELTRCRDLKNL